MSITDPFEPARRRAGGGLKNRHRGLTAGPDVRDRVPRATYAASGGSGMVSHPAASEREAVTPPDPTVEIPSGPQHPAEGGSVCKISEKCGRASEWLPYAAGRWYDLVCSIRRSESFW